MLKNKQVRLVRAIEKAKDRIAQHEMDIRTEQMRVDQMMDRYMIRERLREMGSVLQPVSNNSLVVIETQSESDHDSVAVVSP